MNLPWLEAPKAGLAERLEAGRLGHAPLVHGPAGIGKLELVRWLTRRMLCLAPDGIEPCGQCRACQLLDTGSHPDYFEIDVPEDKQVIPVDLIRELIEKMHLTPSIGRHRVGVIVTAEAMNINAANALLKTLEEPSSDAWLILRSHQPARLPATIRSRCQKLTLRPPPQELAADWLAEACPGSDSRHRRSALALSGGAPLAARELLVDGELDRGLEILHSLLHFGSGTSPAELIDNWQQDAAGTWQWLAQWVALILARARQAKTLDVDLTEPLPADLPAARLAQLWQQALQGRRLAMSGSVRQDLLLGKWLLEWESLNESRS